MRLTDRLSQPQKIVIVIALGMALGAVGTYLTSPGNATGFGWYAYAPLSQPVYPPRTGLAEWLRLRWAEAIAEPGRFKLARPETAVPAINLALADSINDQAFVAGLLHAAFDALDPAPDPEYRKQLAVIAKRA